MKDDGIKKSVQLGVVTQSVQGMLPMRKVSSSNRGHVKRITYKIYTCRITEHY